MLQLKSLIPEGLRPHAYLRSLVSARTGGRIAAGPFEGMRYVRASVGSAYIPKLLGIYERELSGVVGEILSGSYDRIVDIGAAEGYYAVGLALRMPELLVDAFEMDPEGRVLLTEMARLNGVSARVRAHEKCEAADLRDALRGSRRPLVVCDVEGYETVLMDLDAVPELRNASILLELHEFVHRGVGDLIRSRFDRTHRIHHVAQEDRSVREFPYRSFLTAVMPARYLERAVTEWRPEQMSWYWMEPRAADSGDDPPSA
jgi:hypothetical protein